MLRILNVEPYRFSEKARSIYRQLGEYVEKTLSREALLREIEVYDILVMRFDHCVDEALLKRASKLKVVATNVTGPDRVDADALKHRAIRLICLKDQPDFMNKIYASAEHTWALLMALVRKIPAAVFSVLNSQWDRNQFMGNELHGKAMGILGLGRNGKKVAEYATVFGMRVCGYDIQGHSDADTIQCFDSLEDLLSVSDVLSIHLPLSEQTRHMINGHCLATMPKGAFLVNTSRGAIVHEPALLEALESGHLAGAALDVIEGEWDSKSRQENRLIAYAKTHDNLIVTPHIGGVTVEAWEQTEVFIAEQVRSYITATKAPRHED